MELKHIELTNLKPAKTNVRKKGAKDIDDLVPSIKSLGIIQPLLVRPNGSDKTFEVVAGQRRFHALTKIAETDNIEPVPCLVMDEGDDAQAVEASLAENIARLPMDEIDQYKAFATLIKQDKSVDDIASMFGVTERLVKQRLAIANLIAPILTAYRKGDIRAETLRILTMATKQQQKDWYAMVKADDCYPPTGRALKGWLFGGAEIATDNALFDLSDYTGNIVSDLFGEKAYFDDGDQFWTLQNTAIAKLKSDYLEGGWKEVVVQEIGEHWYSWEMMKRAKSKGGKIFLEIGHDGSVTIHEGYLPSAEAKKLDKAASEGEELTALKHKPELTKPAQNYLDLHRHSAVRTDLLNHQGLALRFAVAQIIAGSNLWQVKADPQKASKPEIAESLATNKAKAVFEAEREAICQLLGIGKVFEVRPDNNEGDSNECDEDVLGDEADETDNPYRDVTLVPRPNDWHILRDGYAVLAKLITLDDSDVMRIMSFVVTECLPCGSTWIEALGQSMQTDMSNYWTPDQAFLDLVRDKNTLNLLVDQVAGKATADAHVTSTGKVQRNILSACIKGERKATENAWDLPYMQFPMKDYTDQFGIVAIDNWSQVKDRYEPDA
ncbi:MAG: ParB/RepB/Spo0J family partition protein [Pseudomonadota bacterium]